MTEDEAKTKWCPMARAWAEGNDGHAASINRQYQRGKPDIDCYCIASDCMMWRSLDGVTVHGYCGLAGKPQA